MFNILAAVFLETTEHIGYPCIIYKQFFINLPMALKMQFPLQR